MLSSVTLLGSNASVRYVDFYGTNVMHAWIENDEGNGIEVCIDCRAESSTLWRLFEGGRHPTKQGALLVELGSEQEGIIIPLLSSWQDSKEARKELTEFGFELFQNALIHYGEPQISGDVKTQ